MDLIKLNQEIIELTNNKYDISNVIEGIRTIPYHEQGNIDYASLVKRILPPNSFASNDNLLAFLTDPDRKVLLNLYPNLESIPPDLERILGRSTLFVGSECENYAYINIEKNFSALSSNLTNRFISIKSVMNDTLERVSEIWFDTRPDIVCFSCHGDKFGLLLRDESGECKRYTRSDISRFFKDKRNYTECIVLSACSSEQLAEDLISYANYVVYTADDIAIDTMTNFEKYFFNFINNHSTGYSGIYPAAYSYASQIMVTGHYDDLGQIKLITSPNIK